LTGPDDDDDDDDDDGPPFVVVVYVVSTKGKITLLAATPLLFRFWTCCLSMVGGVSFFFHLKA